jgi:hypothetical protein
MKTIKQIAEEIGVSKQAIQKRISREPLYTKLYTCLSTNGQTKYIDESGERLIKEVFINKAKPPTAYTNVYSCVCSELVEILHEQLKTKDRLIEKLTAVKTQAESKPRKRKAYLRKEQPPPKSKSGAYWRHYENVKRKT